MHNKALHRSRLAFLFFNVASFVYVSWFFHVHHVGPPTRLPQSLARPAACAVTTLDHRAPASPGTAALLLPAGSR